MTIDIDRDRLTKQYEEFVGLLEQNKSICESLGCKYASIDHETSYGCQRYSVARHCILNEVANTQNTQYFVYPVDRNATNPHQMKLMQLAIESVPPQD